MIFSDLRSKSLFDHICSNIYSTVRRSNGLIFNILVIRSFDSDVTDEWNRI